VLQISDTQSLPQDATHSPSPLAIGIGERGQRLEVSPTGFFLRKGREVKSGIANHG
jgi:DNA mismatch repair protein MutH